MIAVFRVGFTWYQVVTSVLPECALQQSVRLRLTVDELQQHSPEQIQGRFGVVTSINGDCAALEGNSLRLSWRNQVDELVAGDIIVASVRLKPPWGSLNAGGFDYQQWLLASGYNATGYIKYGQLESSQHRPKVAQWVRSVVTSAGLVESAALMALALGDKGGVAPEDWRRLRNTGTVHLFIVSGLHVGLIGGWLYLFCLMSVRLFGWCLRKAVHGHRLAVMVSLLGVACYAWLSGLQPPVLRASLMAAIVVLADLTQRRSVPLRLLLLAFIVSVVLQPLAIFKQGFWLSYFAVAGLCWAVVGYRRLPTKVIAFVRVQFVLFVLMAPILGVWVGAIPLLSIPANLCAVPAITLVALPSLLLGILLEPLAPTASSGLLGLADLSVITTKALLDTLTPVMPLRLQSIGYFPLATALVGGLSALAYCLPMPRAGKCVALLGLSCLLLANRSGVSFGQVRLQVLDVGQGSAAIIDTRTRRLVVDAGPKSENRFDAGESIVIPALRSTGFDQVDLVMLTHMDNDHAGGRAALERRYPNAEQMFGADACVHNKSWFWDGVRFTVLQHVKGVSRNDRSCTLLVESGFIGDRPTHAVYLSGDVSTAAEEVLLNWLPRGVALLITPHHGSRSSSSSAFVRHLAPMWAVHSAGRFNRYGHPRDIVVQRYALEGAAQVITGVSGGITWSSSSAEHLFTQRQRWFDAQR